MLVVINKFFLFLRTLEASCETENTAENYISEIIPEDSIDHVSFIYQKFNMSN